MINWYLLYCKRGQMERAQQHLERQDVGCFSPMITIEKQRRDSRIQVLEPAFPNYLFVKFDPEMIHTTTISATRGVSHFVRFGQLPACVPDALIDALRHLPQPHLPKLPTPLLGDKVIITSGIFQGVSAIYQQQDGETRSMLLLNLLNKSVLRSIDNSQFDQA